MNKTKILIFLLHFFFYGAEAQTNFEFYGIIKLNGNDKTVITYRLVFSENKGIINGYSITDLDGANETKSIVKGTYDKKTKVFEFKENEILYTKSKFSESAFCFVNFSGKVKLVQNTSKLEGNFKGLFKNKTKCIDGTLQLVGSNKIYNLATKVNKKIQKSKKIDEASKEKYNTIKMLDSLKINKLSKDQNLNVFWESSTAKIEIWDNGQEDGNRINLFHNGKLILSDYLVSSTKKVLSVKLSSGNDVFKIVALNEGKIKPNTAKIEFIDNGRSFELLATLSKEEEASITIIKKEP